MYKDFKSPNLETHISEMKRLMVVAEEKVNQLLKIENKTYRNFLKSYLIAFKDLSSHTFYFDHINSVKNTKETQKVKRKSLPILGEWFGRMEQREDVYQALLEVSETALKPAQRRVIEESLLSKKLKGIGQEDSIKNRITQINTKLSELSNTFFKNVLDATQVFTVEVTNPDDVKEFPEHELSRHIKEGTGHWEFTLQRPSFLAYMMYGSNSEIRRKLYTAFCTLASETNEDVIESILTLKNEMAKILGYDNYAEVSLITKMAESSEEVLGFLDRLKEKGKVYFEKDSEALLLFIEKEFGVTELNLWDKTYYINKYKEKIFDFKEEDVKPYFENSSVMEGMFEFLREKFGLDFEQVTDTYVWDDKVAVYDVTRNGKEHSRVYFDNESRDDKKNGAWMDSSQTGYLQSNEEYISDLESEIQKIQEEKNKVIPSKKAERDAMHSSEERDLISRLEQVKESGEENWVLPIAYVTCNFTPSTDNLPSLLSHYEVTTLFHEMGHVLQHICSEVEDETYAGINGIEWDAVEWSSQFLELFSYESDVLKTFGKHYKTGETITDDLIDKINTIRTYRQATALMGQLQNGIFDMKIHMSDITTKEHIQSTLTNVRKALGIQVINDDKFQCSFGHIFSGGYSAGYYSYKWAEVLSVDSFLHFIENNDAEDYYNKFLSKGSSEKSMDMFINYMGRKPDEESLVKYLLVE